MTGERHEPEKPDILIRVSRQLLDRIAEARDVTYELGEPDEEGVYTPVFTKHDRQEVAA